MRYANSLEFSLGTVSRHSSADLRSYQPIAMAEECKSPSTCYPDNQDNTGDAWGDPPKDQPPASGGEEQTEGSEEGGAATMMELLRRVAAALAPPQPVAVFG